mmetsp:Transcript_39238/g.103851  ORF Transcript_39238/g.103851 Transcript_39238/m.103851 type:complete len:351 (+) Transcript_39238:303-1355(+)|eukprot:CAMPEP_0113675308 /NCGR_PEP_ID=MMETSP0038_2-20120614/7939_1 /TAXON_ID=2898 /ORGANISM="Cryptomonas paramecium" /LENGTH=350 /DNA_ID=CAMNT_0000592059 /DNA_START=128 /DNA_END=1180 /DNA_ORIENTATION=+ /assembly_acc=CAM_ASM_000170
MEATPGLGAGLGAGLDTNPLARRKARLLAKERATKVPTAGTPPLQLDIPRSPEMWHKLLSSIIDKYAQYQAPPEPDAVIPTYWIFPEFEFELAVVKRIREAVGIDDFVGDANHWLDEQQANQSGPKYVDGVNTSTLLITCLGGSMEKCVITKTYRVEISKWNVEETKFGWGGSGTRTHLVSIEPAANLTWRGITWQYRVDDVKRFTELIGYILTHDFRVMMVEAPVETRVNKVMEFELQSKAYKDKLDSVSKRMSAILEEKIRSKIADALRESMDDVKEDMDCVLDQYDSVMHAHKEMGFKSPAVQEAYKGADSPFKDVRDMITECMWSINSGSIIDTDEFKERLRVGAP